MNTTGNPISLLTVKGTKFERQVLRCFKLSTDLFVAEDISSFLKAVTGHPGAVVLLDLSLLNQNVAHPGVTPVLTRCAEQKVIIVTDEEDPAHLYTLFRQGVRGFCSTRITDRLLIKAVQAVDNGELWIGRKLTGYLMSQLILERSGVSSPDRHGSAGKTELTPKESEIAEHVAKGKCDKLIARELDISPRTVRNHLSNIFGKLQISDRYQLALIYHGIIVS